jgi:DNA repair protein SbcD/Mre11
MRIVHTADWHVGRVWKNLNRLDETAAVLDHLARFVLREPVDVLLMAGDVFESGSPTAEAERLVFSFFRRLGEAGVQSIVIAGNHDSPARLDAWGMLAELVGVRTVGKPRSAANGGVMEISTRGGEIAMVAALPFAPVRTWVSGLQLATDGSAARAHYREMFRLAVASLSAAFRPDTVNLLIAHTHLEGAVLGGSERRAHVAEDWTAAPEALPAAAQYVALGHIHKPQRMSRSPAPAYYAGSPLPLDFSEVGQRKVFLFIEAKCGEPARIEQISYEGGKPLADVRLTLGQLDMQQAGLRSAGWLRVTVPLDEPDPDLARKVRALVPNTVVVHGELPKRPAQDPARPAAGATPAELYRAYHLREHGQEPEAEVVEAFHGLYERSKG